MVKNYSLKLGNMANEKEINRCLIKAKKAILLHPKSKLELKYFDTSNIGFNCWQAVDNELLMEKFLPFIPMLKKLFIKLDFKESLRKLVCNTHKFEALECLELDVSWLDHYDDNLQGLPFKNGQFYITLSLFYKQRL